MGCSVVRCEQAFSLSWSQPVSVLLCPFQMAASLPPNQTAVFLSLMRMEGRSFSPGDVMEAVQLNRDFPSALRFLTHSCPICQDQVTFSKVSHLSHPVRAAPQVKGVKVQSMIIHYTFVSFSKILLTLLQLI